MSSDIKLHFGLNLTDYDEEHFTKSDSFRILNSRLNDFHKNYLSHEEYLDTGEDSQNGLILDTWGETFKDNEESCKYPNLHKMKSHYPSPSLFFEDDGTLNTNSLQPTNFAQGNKHYWAHENVIKSRLKWNTKNDMSTEILFGDILDVIDGWFDDDLILEISGFGNRYYPKNYMGWHTNCNSSGMRLYLSYARDDYRSYLTYWDETRQKVVKQYDKKGWNLNLFTISNDCDKKPKELFWHAVYSDTYRYSMGINIMTKEQIRSNLEQLKYKNKWEKEMIKKVKSVVMEKNIPISNPSKRVEWYDPYNKEFYGIQMNLRDDEIQEGK